jgi:Tfp pilus assembly protein PilX
MDMKILSRIWKFRRLTLFGRQEGFILIAALTLLTTLILVGVTTYLVSSTNAKVAGNYKLSQAVLQVAMAGAEKARENLRSANASSATTSNFTEELVARVGANATLNGYTSSTDDVPMATGTMSVGGKTYTYNAYMTNDSTDGASSTTDTNGRVVITSVATGPNSAKAIVTTTVQLYSFASTSPAVVYSKDNVTLSGSSLSINGNDAGNCGSGNLAAVYNYDPSTTSSNGNPTTTGGLTHGTTNIDLVNLVNTLKSGATTTLSADPPNNSTYGSSTNYGIVYADATNTQADHKLDLNNITGYGILLVNGNLDMAGNINWNGIIIVTGVLSSSGGGKAGKNITGQVYSGSSALGDTTISGNIDIAYDSCAVKKSLAGQPLAVVNWKQS